MDGSLNGSGHDFNNGAADYAQTERWANCFVLRPSCVIHLGWSLVFIAVYMLTFDRINGFVHELARKLFVDHWAPQLKSFPYLPRRNPVVVLYSLAREQICRVPDVEYSLGILCGESVYISGGILTQELRDSSNLDIALLFTTLLLHVLFTAGGTTVEKTGGPIVCPRPPGVFL